MAYKLPSIITAAALLCSCTHHAVSNKPTATVAIAPLVPLATAVAGDRADVVCLVPGDTDPETYDPTLATLAALERSDVYFAIGNMPFEDRMLAMLSEGRRRFDVVQVSDGIKLIEGTHGPACSHDHEGHDGHNHTYDPHTWSSVRNAAAMTDNIVRGLSKADPDGAAGYRQRGDSLKRVLAAKDSVWSAVLKPARGTAFAVWHPSLSYFARDYGLRQLAVGTEGKEMSIREMMEAVSRIDSLGVRVLITQPGLDTRPTPLADRHKGRMHTLTFAPLSAEWIADMDALTDSIAAIAANPIPNRP